MIGLFVVLVLATIVGVVICRLLAIVIRDVNQFDRVEFPPRRKMRE